MFFFSSFIETKKLVGCECAPLLCDGLAGTASHLCSNPPASTMASHHLAHCCTIIQRSISERSSCCATKASHHLPALHLSFSGQFPLSSFFFLTRTTSQPKNQLPPCLASQVFVPVASFPFFLPSLVNFPFTSQLSSAAHCSHV